MELDEFREMQRIANALERIATALESKQVTPREPAYEPIPYWLNPRFTKPEVT